MYLLALRGNFCSLVGAFHLDNSVLAKVTAEVQVPFSDRPTEGFLQFSTELTSVAVPNYEPGRFVLWLNAIY